MDRPPFLRILEKSLPAEVFFPILDESLPADDGSSRIASRRRVLTVFVSEPLATTPTVLESDTEGENADDLIDNLGTVGTLDTLRDLEDYGGFSGRMSGGSVDVASRRRSRSPTPHPRCH